MQCRACRRFNCKEAMDMGYVVPTDGKTLYDYFNDCTQLAATTNDDLPKMLCINCTQNLRQAYNFIQEARRSDEELKQLLALEKDQPVLVCNDADQSDVLEDIEDSSFDQLSVSPKKGADFDIYSDHSNELEDIEDSAFDLSAGSAKNEPLVVYEPIEQSEVLEDMDKSSTFDPLSASGTSRQSTTKSSTIASDQQNLNINIKEEIKIEISTDMFENSNDDQFEDDDKEENSDNYELRGRKMYICDFCVYAGRTRNELKKHIFELHKDTIICEKCSKVFELPEEMQLHKKLVHDKDSVMCCPCCKNSSRMPNNELVKHIQRKHHSMYLKYFPRLRVLCRGEDGSFQCERCPKFFTSIDELANHMREHKYDCPLCFMSFKKQSSYSSHVQRTHKLTLTRLKAILSGNEENKMLLQQQQQPQQINMEFNCSFCKKQFKLERHFQQHMKSKHKECISNSQNDINAKDQPDYGNDISEETHRDGVENSATVLEMDREYEHCKLVECKYCHKKIPAYIIREHEKGHKRKKDKKYLCSYCSREFKSETYLKLHEKKIHLCDKSERKPCPICKKNLDARYLKIHVTSVHNSERKYACDICGDLFKTNALRNFHKKLHLDRKIICTVCNKGFIRASVLKVHMRSHTGEEPFACHICEQRFKTKVRLDYHLERHAGIKRKCNVCDKEFNRADQLRIHSYKHTGMPYRCSVCKFKCAHREVFVKHLFNRHEITMTTDELAEMFKANTGRYPRVWLAKDLATMDDVTQEAESSN